jgi:phage I-like protein
MSRLPSNGQIVVFERGGTIHLRTTASIALAQGTTSSWIQVAVIGAFTRGDRKFSITPAMLREMVENFSTGKHPVPPTELCVDYEHLSADPPDPEAGKAAGWFKELETRDDGAALYGRVEWTPPAAERLRDHEFKFISPEFAFNFTTPTGETIGCTLLAAAITNRPFLQGMEPIMLRTAAIGDLALVADLSYEQRRMFIERALRKRSANTGAYCYVLATKEDRVVYESSASAGLQYFEESYAIGADGEVTLGGDPVEVVVDYQPLGAEALRTQGDGDMKTIKLRVGDKDIEVPETAIEGLEVVKQLRADLAARPDKAAHEKLLADNVALTGRVDKLETDNKTAQAAIATRDAKEAVEKLVAGGRATDGQREPLEKLYLSNRELFEAVTAGFPQRIAEGEIGHGKKGPEAGSAVSTVMAEIAKLRAADPKLTEAEAQAQVFSANTTLYARYVKETEVKVGKGAVN